MAFHDSPSKPLLWLLPAVLILATGGSERDAARRRLFVPVLLAAGLVLFAAMAALAANGGGTIMHLVRWKRLLLRGGLLLVLALNAVCIFLALDAVADRLLGVEGAVSFGVARVVCALTAVAAHLDFGWVAVHGD
ncbi:hypothetical protein ZWY2020_046906 [Hordeum vulgare]|nr:hypothetical protein ZWY2020_046906 [Hordeum vulgare]